MRPSPAYLFVKVSISVKGGNKCDCSICTRLLSDVRLRIRCCVNVVSSMSASSSSWLPFKGFSSMNWPVRRCDPLRKQISNAYRYFVAKILSTFSTTTTTVFSVSFRVKRRNYKIDKSWCTCVTNMQEKWENEPAKDCCWVAHHDFASKHNSDLIHRLPFNVTRSFIRHHVVFRGGVPFCQSWALAMLGGTTIP